MKKKKHEQRKLNAHLKETLGNEFTQEQVNQEFNEATKQWDAILLRNNGSRIVAIANDQKAGDLLLVLSCAIKAAKAAGFSVPNRAKEIVRDITIEEQTAAIKQQIISEQ